jgi:hypothetical protein
MSAHNWIVEVLDDLANYTQLNEFRDVERAAIIAKLLRLQTCLNVSKNIETCGKANIFLASRDGVLIREGPAYPIRT